MRESIKVQVIGSPLDEAGLRSLIDAHGAFELVRHNCCGPVCTRSCITDAPHVVVIKVSSDDLEYYACIRQISAWHPDAWILLVSSSADPLVCKMAMNAGATGFVSSKIPPRLFIKALHQVADGKPFVEAWVAKRMIEDGTNHTELSPFEVLSKREYMILQMMLSGQNNKQIADRLHISINTLGNHRSHIKSKLGVSNLVELTKLAMRYGIKEL